MIGASSDSMKSYHHKDGKLEIKTGGKTTLKSIMEQAELFDPDTGPSFNKDDFNSNFLSPNSPLPNRCFSPMSVNGAGRSKYNGSVNSPMQSLNNTL